MWEEKDASLRLYAVIESPHQEAAVDRLDFLCRKHVQMWNGVLTEIKLFGIVQLGYGRIDANDCALNFNKELHYLNKEDLLLRWLLVKHRNTKYQMDYDLRDSFGKGDFSNIPRSNSYDDDDDGIDETDDNDEEYREEGEETQTN
ncbi:Ribosomal protein s6 [Thalictrum thalictroides]|uniref:Ribosomal protein s6 n=1 Tax=Thalictrum thalictroides TaxID=46969 RepID=A0A7J6UZA0_THATH|nr:Ribosomal protein s6 [Thalictrum thalictroides]